MSYLDVKQLNKHYGPTKVFHNIDFSAAEGEFVTLLGPSGCGKSTLLRCLAGLTPVDSGQILLQGQDIVPVSPQKRGIGMVFQNYALFPNMTAEGNVAFGLKMQKLGAGEIRQRVALRPESITLGAPGQGIAGEILNHSLLGNVVRYRIVVNGVEQAVDVLNRAPDDLYRTGSVVGVHITADALREVA